MFISGVNYSYSIELQLFQVAREDKFESLKNLRTLLYESINLDDTTKYLANMKENFKNKYGLTSRDNILDRNDFNFRIDDELFKQFYLQIQNVTDYHSPKSLNFKQFKYNLYSTVDYSKLRNPDFVFSISAVSRHAEMSNEDNYTKLVVSILNTLSLWFNICALSLIVYINSFNTLFTKVHLLLIKLKSHFYSKIKNDLIVV